MPDLKQIARNWLPYNVRVEIARAKHTPKRALQNWNAARQKGHRAVFPYLLDQRCSPIYRQLEADDDLARAKKQNVATAAARVHLIRIAPNQVFSFHALVGRPSRLRGFLRGRELHDEKMTNGVGGGMCKLSNALFQVALKGGMKIIERHRHSLDLYPDNNRQVPFGLGATVAFNYANLRFQNPLPYPVLVIAEIVEKQLQVELRTTIDPGWRVEVYEKNHRFFKKGETWWRKNEIRRRFTWPDNELLKDELVAENKARLLYTPRLELPPIAEGE